LNLAAAEETAGIIREEGGDCLAVQANAAISTDVKGTVEQTLAAYDRIDILHNNVGICRAGSPVTLSEEDWDLSIDSNLKSVFLACKFVLPVMEKQGSGIITNISSILSVRVSQYDQIAYYASKAGVDHFTRAVAVKYAGKGIRCNVILPGLINTPLLYHNPKVVEESHGSLEQMVKDRDAMSPTGKMGESWDIANAAVFLASDKAKYINGVQLPVDGGLINLQSRG
jgi:NAD(P)-dependent dehydrogenase (short-subunit alcohol dehydrogenase family)